MTVLPSYAYPSAIQLLCDRIARHRSSPAADLATAGETIYSIFPVPNSRASSSLLRFVDTESLSNKSVVLNMFILPVLSTVTWFVNKVVHLNRTLMPWHRNRAIFSLMKTVIWRFATLDLHGSRILKWLAMYRRGIIARRKSCLLGRSMMLQSTSGAQAASSRKCSRVNPYSLERTVSISPSWISHLLNLSRCQPIFDHHWTLGFTSWWCHWYHR